MIKNCSDLRFALMRQPNVNEDYIGSFSFNFLSVFREIVIDEI